ncbi:MAG: NAD(P)/FAD-dependent oxidoreductase [Bacteroidetes bacterium]|jgi:predicted Rossmann fold flavoprotein|nr:NAD(P)/FAD-dependent oxidoreductase [Bacteroidota bacterium]
MRVCIIGAGAAGLFAALRLKALQPGWEVRVLEQKEPLAKVRISGGGRCNVTHDPARFRQGLRQLYPRGAQFMQQALKAFGAQDTLDWFAHRGVALKREDDGRMFPTTDRSQTIVDCLLQEAHSLGVQLHTGVKVRALHPGPPGHWQLETSVGTRIEAYRVLVATGGSPGIKGLDWLQALGLEVVPPVPSLFTFNLQPHPMRALQGVSAPAVVSLPEQGKLSQEGPLLITHWGLSGPAVLKLSAFAARALKEADYRYRIRLCWLPGWDDTRLRSWIELQRTDAPKKRIRNTPPAQLPRRLWAWLCQAAGLADETAWASLPAGERNRLTELLLRHSLTAAGKTTFKDEFVTAGGIALGEVGPQMEAKRHPGLFLAGEVLDIDGITGGFNFQAAWTTGWLAGTGLASGT